MMSANRKKSRARAWALVLAMALGAAFLAGCGGAPPRPSQKWTLEYPAPQPVKAPLAASLRLAQFTSGPRIDGPRMVYRPGQNQRAVYPYNHWWAEPARMAYDMMLRDLSQGRYFQAVFASGQRGRARFSLEGCVLRFVELDLKKGWQALIHLNLIFCDEGTKDLRPRVLWQRDYRVSVPIKHKGARGLAMAMSLALQEASGRAIGDMRDAAQKALAKPAGVGHK